MADDTAIEWTDSTWNPIRGCSRVSAGCAHCYAETMAARFSDPGQWGHGLAERGKGWTNNVALDEAALLKPLRWRKPRRIFVTSIGDPFHPSVTDEMLDRLFAIMALASQHTFQLLTKRPERMGKYLADCEARVAEWAVLYAVNTGTNGDSPRHHPPLRMGPWTGNTVMDIPRPVGFETWPLPNLWLGTSVENQITAAERIPHLLATPATLRFLSCEPLLGPVNVRHFLMDGIDPGRCGNCGGGHGFTRCPNYGGVAPKSSRADGSKYDCDNFRRVNFAIDWVIVGGESGPKARPMHPDWARSLRDQCAAAGVPFLFKQWGEWTPGENVERQRGRVRTAFLDADEEGCGEWFFSEENLASTDGHIDDEPDLYHVGKKAAGRLLDGVEYNVFPEVAR